MKKFLLFIVFVFVLCLSSCVPKPFETRPLEKIEPEIFRVYVCGAIANEGFVEISEGTDYRQLVYMAGYIPQTVMPNTPYAVVSRKTETFILRYYDGAKFCYCTNINGAAVKDRLEIENVSTEVVDKIANYLEKYGKITDKTQLKYILNEEEYQNSYYKFFVSREDYEKVR